MDAVLIVCNLAILQENQFVATGKHGTPGFYRHGCKGSLDDDDDDDDDIDRARSSSSDDDANPSKRGPNDCFSSVASDVFSAGVYIACLFRYVTLGDHRSEERRKRQHDLSDGEFWREIAATKLSEWGRLLSLIELDEPSIRRLQEQKRQELRAHTVQCHFLEPYRHDRMFCTDSWQA